MPAIGNLTINDGQSTPVAHSFAPVSTTGNESRYADRSGGVPSGFPTIYTSQKDPANGSRNFRMQFNVALPTVVTDAVTGATSVTRVNRVNIEFVLADGSVLQERKDILAYAKNLLATSAVQSVVQDLEHIY